jgi:nucleosome binding factor SPN SPT16 subunit
MPLLEAQTFWARVSDLHKSLTSDCGWNDAETLAIPVELPPSDEIAFSKSSAFFIHLFGLELYGSLAILCKDALHVVAPDKTCAMLEGIRDGRPIQCPNLLLHRLCKDGDHDSTYETLVNLFKGCRSKKVGRLLKMKFHGKLASCLDKALAAVGSESIDVTASLGLSMSVKDNLALSSFRKAAIITHKVLKHSFVRLVEDAFDQGKSIKHEEIAARVDECCEDPSRINIKPPPGHYESCYFPIVQSGGDYDLRPSATTNNNMLSDDVIIVSLGVRYNFHCANITRTFFVDPVPRVEANYMALLEVQRACLAVMLSGNCIGLVAETAANLVRQKHPHLLQSLPKSLGFGLALDFRESALLLNVRNQRKFAPNMVFNLAVGFQDLELTSTDKISASGSIRNLSKYSMLVADTVIIQANGEPPDVLTKHSNQWRDVSYFINNRNDEPQAQGSTNPPKKGAVLDSRLRNRSNTGVIEQSNNARHEKQAELMQQKLATKRDSTTPWNLRTKSATAINVMEVNTYQSTKEYPRDLPASEVFVDMQGQVIFAPMNGSQVPFHVSMIKNAVQPDPDRTATYLRINFFTPGQTLSKDVAPGTSSMIDQHSNSSTFVKEMLFRSQDSQRLTAAYRMIQELRKRFRQNALKAAEEADLVAQEKLVKMRDQRIPRMADLTMRPFISGKKTTGTLETHTNGLRFTSKKHEIIDVMFSNIKHSLFQPCENEVMVLIHFHLKNPVLIGKKKTKDVQFFTEVIDASVALDNARRSVYDPDEFDEEQRERQLRKRLNEMFKEFCKKMERVAKHHHHHLEFDIPYRDLGFHGVPNREMVLIQPTVHCLVNLTESPMFVVELDDVEHIHFERCTFRSKNFDMIIILKNFELAPHSINAIPMNELDAIQEWLTDCSLTYTAGQASMSWKSVMNLVRNDARFYLQTDENNESKPAGWQFLQADDGGGGDGEGDDGDEDYNEEDFEVDTSDDEEDDDDAMDDDSDTSDDDEEDALDWDSIEAASS